MTSIGYRPEKEVLYKIDELCHERMWSRNKAVTYIVSKYFAPSNERAKPEAVKKQSKEIAVKKAATRFKRPGIDEVSQYFYERGSKTCNDDASAFMDHFDSNGWKVGGKAPMKDWKAAIRNWMKNKQRGRNGTNQSNGLTSGPTITTQCDDF